MTPRYTPWMQPHHYEDDYSQLPTGHPNKSLFIHEMMHVLQSQKGNVNWIEGPWLWLTTRDYQESYDYDPADLGQPLYRFNLEQQAMIIQHLFEGEFEGEELERALKTLEGFRTQMPGGI